MKVVFAVFFCLFALANCQVLVGVYNSAELDDSRDDVYGEAYLQNSLAVENVTFVHNNFTSSVANMTLEFGKYPLVIFSLTNLTVDPFNETAAAEAAQNYVADGGMVMIMGNLTNLPQFFSLVGASNSSECDLYDISEYFYNDTMNLSNDALCAPFIDGFSDITDVEIREETYYTIFDYSDRSLCLNLTEGIESPAVNCFGLRNNSLVSVREVGDNSGKYIYFNTDMDSNDFFSAFGGFYFKMLNNFMVSLGAVVPDVSSYAPINVLFLTDLDDEDTLTTVFNTAGLSNANVVTADLLDLTDLITNGDYDMVITRGFDDYEEASGADYATLEAFANAGGVVLLTGYDSGREGDQFYALLGVADGDDCSSWDDTDLDPFPTMESMCEPLLNGGWTDLRGIDPESLAPYGYLLTDDMDCHQNIPGVSAKCLTSVAYDQPEDSIWTIRSVGTEGGVIVWMAIDDDYGAYVFNTPIFRAGLLNLMVYAGRQPVFSAITAESEWGMYLPACIEWNAQTISQERIGTSMNIWLDAVDGSVSVLIVEDMMVASESYVWPRVYGISTKLPVWVRFSFEGEDPLYSEVFTLITPSLAQEFPCVTVEVLP